MMNDEIFLNERIDVLAKFGTGLNPCVPLKFRRPNGREEFRHVGWRHQQHALQERRACMNLAALRFQARKQA